jgi:hypothetical protein
MHPSGFYDLREAPPRYRWCLPPSARPIRMSWRAIRPVFTLAAGHRRPPILHPRSAHRVDTFLARAGCRPLLIATARRVAAEGGCPTAEAPQFVAAAVSAFALSREPITAAGTTSCPRSRRSPPTSPGEHHPHQSPDGRGCSTSRRCTAP